MDAKALLKQAIDAGATFADCIRAFGSEDDPHARWARNHLHKEGELEIDDITVASGSGDDGDYIMAWVWVSNKDAGLPSIYDEEEDDDEDEGMSSLEEIKAAVDAGSTVHWKSSLYRVVNNGKGDYFIQCTTNGHCIGLTWADGTTLNGKPEEFYVAD